LRSPAAQKRGGRQMEKNSKSGRKARKQRLDGNSQPRTHRAQTAVKEGKKKADSAERNLKGAKNFGWVERDQYLRREERKGGRRVGKGPREKTWNGKRSMNSLKSGAAPHPSVDPQEPRAQRRSRRNTA